MWRSQPTVFNKAVVKESLILVALRSGNLGVIDASTLTQISVIPVSGAIECMVWHDQYAYLAVCREDGSGGVQVVNMNNLHAPILGSFHPLPWYTNAQGMVIVDNYLYIICAQKGLGILDLSDQAKPSQVGFVPGMEDKQGIASDGKYIYWISRSFGTANAVLRVLEMKDQTRPTTIGRIELPGGMDFRVVAMKNYVIVGSWSGIYAVDVSKPTRPKMVARFKIPIDDIVDMIVANDLNYILYVSNINGLYLLRPTFLK